MRPAGVVVRGELSAVVRDNHPRLASAGDQIRQLPGYTQTGDRDVGDRGQTQLIAAHAKLAGLLSDVRSENDGMKGWPSG